MKFMAIKRCMKPYVKDPDTKKCSKSPKVIKKVECRKNKVKLVMGEFKNKKLFSHKKLIENHRQAIAIALSMAKRHCK